jgi:hypothetical protein
MKKQLPFFFLIILSVLAVILPTGTLSGQNKQPYEPMALEGAHWTVGLWDSNNPPWAPDDMYQYVIRGDSLYNGQLYKKVYYRDMDDSTGYILNKTLGGLMRDDTLNRKVYAINFGPLKSDCCPPNEEYLLYDFNLEIGDTANFCTICSSWWFVYDIDYYYLFGKERKLYFGNMMGDYLIEGVGSSYGVFEWGYGSKDDFTKKRGWEYILDFSLTVNAQIKNAYN